MSLSREHVRDEDHEMLLTELLSGTDRTRAIIGAALADTALTGAIMSRFIKMSEQDHENLFYSPTAPLASFSGRIKIGFALAIYGPDVRDILDVIRRIRNVFAHAIRPLEFTHELIVEECQNLPKTAKLQTERPHNLSRDQERYLATCFGCMIILDEYGARHGGKMIDADLARHPDFVIPIRS